MSFEPKTTALVEGDAEENRILMVFVDGTYVQSLKLDLKVTVP